MKILFQFCLAALWACRLTGAESKIETLIARQTGELVRLAATPEMVAMVAAQNFDRPAAYQTMSQAKWARLTRLDPFVYGFKKNSVADQLRKLPRRLVTEAFVSDAAGCKVGFIEKPTTWCHAGKPKHDDPMQGKIWTGKIEIDASTGTKQVQIAVPILSEGKPIGSLVVGLSIFELADK